MLVTLPNPCPIDGEPVTVEAGKRGPRPVYCSPECKRSADASNARSRRATAKDDAEADALAREMGEDDYAPGPVRNTSFLGTPQDHVGRGDTYGVVPADALAAEHHGDADLGAAGNVMDGYVERKAKPRADDAAAQWLAENHPDELADFGADY